MVIMPELTPFQQALFYAHHYLDSITFVMATLIVLVGASMVSLKRPLTILILATTLFYIVAQSSWFSAWLAGDEWGRGWANYIWFVFNTSTMVIFSWTLLSLRYRSTDS